MATRETLDQKVRKGHVAWLERLVLQALLVCRESLVLADFLDLEASTACLDRRESREPREIPDQRETKDPLGPPAPLEFLAIKDP